MKIYIDDVEIEVETIMMLSKGTIVKPEPPKDDTPPVRPLPDVSSNNLGALTETSGFRR